jgi:hypothetical protein
MLCSGTAIDKKRVGKSSGASSAYPLVNSTPSAKIAGIAKIDGIAPVNVSLALLL